MEHPPKTTITQLLLELQGGDRTRYNELFPLVYEELRALAHRQRQQWHGHNTVNTTALVHEAYEKLVDHARVDWESRAHFFAVAAKAMGYILLDYAKRRRAQKRGGDQQRVSFDERMGAEGKMPFSDEAADMLVALGEALKKLEKVNERQSRVVECRFFGSMTIKETAAALGISVATVNRDWEKAQAWLYREMSKATQGAAD